MTKHIMMTGSTWFLLIALVCLLDHTAAKPFFEIEVKEEKMFKADELEERIAQMLEKKKSRPPRDVRVDYEMAKLLARVSDKNAKLEGFSVEQFVELNFWSVPEHCTTSEIARRKSIVLKKPKKGEPLSLINYYCNKVVSQFVYQCEEAQYKEGLKVLAVADRFALKRFYRYIDTIIKYHGVWNFDSKYEDFAKIVLNRMLPERITKLKSACLKVLKELRFIHEHGQEHTYRGDPEYEIHYNCCKEVIAHVVKTMTSR